MIDLQVQSVAVPGVIPVAENRQDGPDVATIYIPGPAGVGVLRSAEVAQAAAGAAATSAAGALHGLDVRTFGGSAGGSSAANAAAFAATVAAAIADGVRRVYIPFDSWTVTTGTDAQGCIVCGNGKTALTGVIGASRYDGCIIDGSVQDYRTIHPVIPFDVAPKLVKIHDANTMRIVVEKPTTGYSYLTFKNNSTTAGTDSLATPDSDATMWRMTALQDAVECLVGVLTPSVKSATVATAAKSGGNTGTGTITMDAVSPVLSGWSAGVYQVRCTGTAADGGTFSVTAPGGGSLGTVAVGGTFSSQVKFVIADGGTDFIVGDGFDITVTDNHWAGVTLTTDVPTHTSGTSYSYQRSTAIGAWYEWTVTVPLDGELIVGFLDASGASSDVTITVDGVAIDSNFTTVSATVRRRLRKYSVAPGLHTVRVTNNTAGSTGLNLLGLYFARLKDARNDISYDTYGVYRNNAYLDPVIQSSANDLVLKDYNSTVNGTPGIYGGSYHGGESSISSTLLIDGAAQAITSGNLYVGKSVELHQSCTITWSGAKSGCTYSGDSVDVRSRTIILRGGLANCPTVTGEFTARELYTTLVGVNEGYTALTAPIYKLLSEITDTSTLSLGQQNSIEYAYGNQRLRITHSSFEAPDSARGGSYVWRVVGSYVKYYSPWIWRGKRDVTGISSVTIIQAS